MKLLLYSDLHISKTSSILPISAEKSKFSYRQNMIIETGKYLATVADENNVDMIINLGDTFDVHTITSYDIVTASEFFKCFRYINVPHIVLVGNHEMVNRDFNAVELLSNIDNITVITEPSSVNAGFIASLRHPDADLSNTPKSDNTVLAFLPYCNYRDILEFPDGEFLFSHQDIQGSSIRGDITLQDGINTATLKDKYKLVFNGHIHKSSIMGNIINVGSVTTHSFADDDLSVPQCYIFDTNTLDLTTFKPTICPLFRKLDVTDKFDLCKQLDSLDDSYKYVINCSCPYECKDDIKTILNTSAKVINHRLSTKIDKTTESKDNKAEIILQQSNLDITQSFTDFLETVDIKFPKQLYLDIIKEVSVSETR